MPEVAVVLGSGLGNLSQHMEDATAVPFGDIPHFPQSTVVGHSGRLVGLAALTGIAAWKWEKVDTAIKPLLAIMQTLPFYTYLLPAVIFCLRFTGQGMASHVAMPAASAATIGIGSEMLASHVLAETGGGIGAGVSALGGVREQPLNATRVAAASMASKG